MTHPNGLNKKASSNIPEIEHDYLRSVDIGYKPDDATNFLSCIEHGAPHPLIRWHHHEQYELHLITETSGTMFVGDYIGDFSPGNLVLIGPFLPHNWVSNKLPNEGVQSRDISLQFLDGPFRNACEFLPEMRQVLPLLDRAKHGIEFFGVSEFAKQQLHKIKEGRGLNSFNDFLKLMSVLSAHNDYQLLSSIQLKTYCSDNMNKFSKVIDYITENYSTQITMANIATTVGMEGSQFSRMFKESVGCTFTDFVNHTRINKACQLLAETSMYISTISYDIGYNSVANFNRRFVERKKMTPTEYRKFCKTNFQD